MSDRDEPPVPHGPGDVDDTPTVSCTRCGEEWSLAHELDDLGMGNDAFEAFAIDHYEHTGHFPDDVSPWVADCQRCPETVRRLDETGAHRWARTHARHTRHRVFVEHATRAEPEIVERE